MTSSSRARGNLLPRRLSVLLSIWFCVFILPSARITFFDGIPFSSAAEAAALAVLAPLALSGTVRRALGRWLARSPASIRSVLVATALVALTLKLVLLAAPPTGFPACYVSTLTRPPAGTCERSYENPFFRFRATRVDPSIDFGPEDWNLSFFNSSRFNFYPWEPGHRRRDRLPFSVTWRGAFDSAGGKLSATYVGEAAVAIDARVLPLPPVYDAPRTVTIDVPPGRHHLRIAYTFDDGSQTRERRRYGRYATFRVTTARPHGVAGPLRAAPPPLALRTTALILDALGIGLAAGLLIWYAWLLRREVRSLGMVIALAAIVFLGRTAGLPVFAGAILITWSLLALILAQNRPRRLLLAYFAVLGVSAWLAIGAYPGPGSVRYRGAGHDWLTYESDAREILETRSLVGAEPVFYTQPLFRYVRFAEHLVLGDGDPLIDWSAWTALTWSILWAASALLAGKVASMTRTGVILFAAGGALTLALAASPWVLSAIRLSLSEHVTWFFLAVAFACLSSRRALRWIVGAGALAAALITRPNQAPALLAILVGLLTAAARPRRHSMVPAAATFALVCLLPLAHNLYYGGRPVLFTTTASHPATLGVPIGTLARVASDARARDQLFAQMRALLFIRPLPSRPPISLAVLHALQAAWLAAVLLAWWSRAPLQTWVLLAVPALYLSVHIVYDVTSYYPRHVLAAYFAMGLVTMTTVTARAR